MLEYARWKYVLALLVLLLSALYALPNLYPQDPSVQITANRGSQVDAALQTRVEALLKEAGVTPKSVEIEKGGNLLVRTLSPAVQTKAADALNAGLGSGYVVALNLASTVPDWLDAIYAKPMLLGLDLQGGVHFLMIRPQMKRAKEHRAMLEKLGRGDEVLTNGGIAGSVTEIGDSFITVEIADNVRIRVQKGAIANVLPKGTLKSA